MLCLACIAGTSPPAVRPLQMRGQRGLRPATAQLRARIEKSPPLPFYAVHFYARAPYPGWHSGVVSSVAIGRNGLIYELQRGKRTDPVLLLNQNGRLLRSWGKGDFVLPHSIRIDSSGRVWAVDAASSEVVEYSSAGKRLMTISVGGQPDNGSAFNGATDVAFGPDGRIFITDGYGNARVLVFRRDGTIVGGWGTPGAAPGEFHLPHAIQIDQRGTFYIADRENGRIEEFDRHGVFLREIAGLGRVYSLRLDGTALWATMGPLDQPPGSPGWIVKIDLRTGDFLGHLDVAEPLGGHSMDLMPSGEPVITLDRGLLWFKWNRSHGRTARRR